MSTGTTTTTSVQTITLQPGEVFTLPPGASLLFVSDVDSIQSECAEIPETTAKCGVFYFNIDDDTNDNHPLDEDSTTVASISIGGSTYTIGQLVDSANVTNLNENLNTGGLFSFTSIDEFTIDDSGDNKRKAIYIFFTVIESFYDSLLLAVTAHTDKTRPSIQYYKPLIETECGDYNTASFGSIEV
jgi:hypothetical protein